jgi:putative transposase
MIRKSYKYRLYPNKEQEQKLIWTLDRCRELYNAALQERKEAYKYVGQSISHAEQSRELTEIRQEIRQEYQEINAHVLQDVLKRLDKTFQAFFRRIKIGEKPGFPRFQGRDRYNSFTNPDGLGHGVRIEKSHLIFPKIGSIKIKLHRSIEGKIKTTTIKREGEQWYVNFSCEIEAEKLPISYEDVGIDLGITHFAALSDGTFIDNPRYYRKAEKTLERRQQALSRKKKGSHRREKAKRLVAKAHRKIRNQRKDFLHKGSRKLVDHYQVIVFEDLQTANLVKRPKPKQDEETGQYLHNGASAKAGLNKSISDAGWAEFVQYCTYKAEYAGRCVLTVRPNYTSQICPGCGIVKKKALAERWHSCECGTELDRDHAAAINILRLGQNLLAQAS